MADNNAYIKTIKENELINGGDDSDVYPITSTQAIFSQTSEGGVPEGVKPKLEDRLKDHEDDAVELHSKTELFSASLSASPSATTFELTQTRREIILTPGTSIKTYGDFGERATTSDTQNLVVSDTVAPDEAFEPATLVDNGNGTYTWTVANKIGAQTATFTAVKNGYPRTATRSVSLYLRKYFAFVDSDPVNVEVFTSLLSESKAVSEYSTNIACSVSVPANGTGAKHLYIAMPSNMPLLTNNYLVYETSSNLEFRMTSVGNIPRTINGKTLTYRLYKSVATPDSANSKDIYIKTNG